MRAVRCSCAGPRWRSTFRTCRGPWLRLALAIAFAAFGIWALWITRRPRMPWVFAALFVAVCAWWVTIVPSHDRDWRKEVAVMPHAFIDGDTRAHHRRARFRLPEPRRLHRALRGTHRVAVAPDRRGLLRVVLDGGTHRAHVPELRLRQRAAAQRLDRDAAGGRRRLFAARLDVQGISNSSTSSATSATWSACARTSATRKCSSTT